MLVLASGLPATTIAVVLLKTSTLPQWLVTILTVIVVSSWLGVGLAVHAGTRFHLRTLSNLLAALREGDYSFRVRGGGHRDPYAEVVAELNALTESLRRQRVDDLEAAALVRKVMGEIDIAVFAFDARLKLRLVNHAGEQLLHDRTGELIGATASELGLDGCLSGSPARTVTLDRSAGNTRWEMRRGVFRQQGRPLQLIVLSDVSRTLRAEELEAWKRLIRVIGHELNNSLAPIKSLAGSLERLVTVEPQPDDWRTDLRSGLTVISSRAEALTRFMSAYSQLAKMPAPVPGLVDVSACIRGVVHLERRLDVEILGGPEITIHADQDQLEQLLINVIKNAVEASQESNGSVSVRWLTQARDLVIEIKDDGPGLPDTENLFVPFFTTKAEGSGIGLFLCRQVAEAHGGHFTLENRIRHHGC
ncbi:MAG: GHKL domain-containing protein, partial [bacterium]|nr:GHKL domain-containing protein [bacterium]